MKIGDIVVAKKDSMITGEVIAIDDYDRATIKLHSGVEAILHICDLEVVMGGLVGWLMFY